MTSAIRQPLTGPFAWRGPDLAQDRGWQQHLTPEEIAEIDVALAAVRRRGLSWREIGRDDFPLPTLAARLAGIAAELEDGRGFVLLRGLPVERYPEDALRRIWFGLGSHLGTAVTQTAAGELMGEIRNEGAGVGARRGQLDLAGQEVFLSSRARAQSSGPLRFHTDRCDVVGLLCVRPAKEGGLSKVASSVAVHNEILARRPDLLELLYRDYPRSRLGEESGGAATTYQLPVFAIENGRFTSHYSRTFVEAAQTLPGAPRLTPQQWQALDLLAEVAEALSLEMALVPGDMQFLNNHVIYHARSGFADDGGRDRGRLLLRLWLSMPNSRALPANHAVLWRATAAGALRGGIGQQPLNGTVSTGSGSP